MVAADPQAVPVRIEYPDGSTAEQWESCSPQIEELREKILALLNQQGRSLLALNALCQGKTAQENIARKTLEMRQAEAENLIWHYAKYKAIAIAVKLRKGDLSYSGTKILISNPTSNIGNVPKAIATANLKSWDL